MKALVAVVLAIPFLASAQNPIQWNGNARAAIERAQEQQLPVMFWVTEGRDIGDDDDLKDAQEESFRDPIVVAIAEHYYIPVRVSRNSRVLEEAQNLGLPTSHGLCVALVTGDGRVLDQIDPGQVASPEAFAERITRAFRAYRDGFYRDKLKSIITTTDAPKPEVRRAVQTIWRLNILSADQDLVALLDRKDLEPVERQRLYSMLASFATKPCVDALLARAASGDRQAASALAKAEAGALEFLVPQLPTAESATAAQIAAYDATVQIAHVRQRRPADFWTNGKPEDRAKELDTLHARAADVLEYWQQRSGRWR
jgi:hypothetical protein